MSILHLAAIVSACVGVVLSTVQIMLLVWREYERGGQYRTLSLLGAKNKIILSRFRRILIICGGLITFGVLYAIIPYTHERVGLTLLWLGVYLCEIGAALIPAVGGKKEAAHTVLSTLMAGGFLAMAILFVRILPFWAAEDEYIVCLLMGIFAILAVAHPAKFIFYELPFIFLSHVSIVIALIALR